MPGYGTISHKKGYLYDEDWFELGIDIPAGHYSISVENFNWDSEQVSNESFDHFAVVTSFHDYPLIVSDTPGTTFLPMTEQHFHTYTLMLQVRLLAKLNIK